MAKAKAYPEDFFLVRYDDGSSHWFINDPVHMTELEREDNEVQPSRLLAAFAGVGTAENPLRVRMFAYHAIRFEHFGMKAMSDIMNGLSDKVIVDYLGSEVRMTGMKSEGISDYPLLGEVLEPDGSLLETRYYDYAGRCQDFDPMHSLLIRLPKEKDDQK